MNTLKSIPLLLIAILVSIYIFKFFTTAKPDAPNKPDEKQRSAYAPGEVLVKFKPGTSKRVILALKVKLNVKEETFTRSIQVYHWKGDFETEKAIRRLQRSRHVQYAEPNYIVGIE